MRMMMLAMMLGVAGPAWGQQLTDQAVDEVLTGLFTTRGEIQLALLCKFRPVDWYTRHAMSNLQYARQFAIQRPTAFAGNIAAVNAFIYGADAQAAKDATAEFKRYGMLACERLIATGHLPAIDRMPQ